MVQGSFYNGGDGGIVQASPGGSPSRDPTWLRINKESGKETVGSFRLRLELAFT